MSADPTLTALAAAIGQPRSVLIAGLSPGVAEVAGLFGEAKVVTFDFAAEDPGALGGRVIDLLVWREGLSPDASKRLRRALAALEDGGHVIVPQPNAGGWLSDAGLELLRHRQPGRVAVGRKPPAQRPLSVTVGMISMNEAQAVGPVLDEIHAQVPKASILLVDSSKDETPQIAESKGAKVIRQFPPRGYGPAMHRLLYSAETDVVVTIDCDGTYPVDQLGPMVKQLEAGADLVNGTRTSVRPAAMPFANFLANRVFASTANLLHGLSTTDVHSGMRAYRTSMLRGIAFDPHGAALPVDLMVLPARLGYRVIDLPIPYRERLGTTTLHRWDSTVWTFRRLGRAFAKGQRCPGG